MDENIKKHRRPRDSNEQGMCSRDWDIGVARGVGVETCKVLEINDARNDLLGKYLAAR